VLDLFATIDPSKITSKVKLHLLAHLRADIIRFGPLVGVATEAFECFNAIFRYCSVLSNHLSPSRDIAIQLARQEGFKHCLTGGWWPTADGEWERAGLSIRNFIHANPTLQALIGWTTAEPLINGQSTPLSLLGYLFMILGSFKLEPLKRGLTKKLESRTYIAWSRTKAACALNATSERADSQWTRCRFTVARSEDKCFMGSWIFARSPFGVSPYIITAARQSLLLILLILFNSEWQRNHYWPDCRDFGG
jgi:hypothetical protein